ncbi:MAG: c-type cytochrome [Anaerolineales bacterium]|nr:c-type cytochrome [Anaerolineales bacterium]
MRRNYVLWSVLAAFMLVGLLLSGCTGVSTAAEDAGAGSADGEGVSEPVGETEPEQDLEEPMEEVGPKDYGVPADDANVVNPIPADETSLQRGEELYKKSCIDCHGEEGRGDGLAAANLNPQPADFRAEHVKELSDGELFYIITYGIEGSAMQARGFFDEERRWHLVNYLRTFQE